MAKPFLVLPKYENQKLPEPYTISDITDFTCSVQLRSVARVAPTAQLDGRDLSSQEFFCLSIDEFLSHEWTAILEFLLLL